MGNKFLQVELDPASNNNYLDIGTAQLVSVPYAFGAGSAATVKTNANLTGVVTSVGNATSIANGAITSDMIGTLNKSKVGLDLVNNTTDAAKPISTATQTALGNKLNIADSTSSYVTPAQLAAKAFDQTPITNAIAGKLAIADSTNGYVTPAKLAAKTFDQAPINSAIAGKLAIADSTNGYVTPAKLAAKTFDTTSLSNRINTKANDAAVTTALNLKANTSDLSAGLALKIDANKLGASNGVASLNAVGIIPSSQLPPVTLTSTSVVASDAAMITLSSATVGSIAIRTDVNKNYVLTALPASTLGNWVELLTPAAPVQAVNGYTGSVNLTKSDLGLSDVNNTADFDKPISTATQNALNLKANKTDVDASLANKMSTADATAALNLKANKTDVDAALANKISTADATAALNLKANITDVDAALANKISTADATAALNLKSNKTDVDAALANKISTADATAAFNLKLDANKVAAANGVASLNAQGKIPTDQIPAISFSSVKVLASEAEMLAVSTAVIGSVVIRTDESKNYVLSQSNPAERANWVQLLTPAAPVQSVNGKTGTVSISKTDIGLENVQNTSDADKVISTRTQTALDTKVDKVTGKDLSTNDYTTAEKTKLASISATPNLASGVTGILPVANGGTGVATLTGLVKGNGTSALTTAVAGTDYQAPILLTTTGSGAATLSGTTINIPSAVPYSGATGAVDLGAYDLKVNGLNIGKGGGSKDNNTAFGNSSLGLNTTGSVNSAAGFESLKSNTTGEANTAFGAYALRQNQNGARNTAFGSQALQLTNGVHDNTAVGYLSAVSNVSGDFNTAVGSESLLSNTSGRLNTAIGSKALKANINGSGNTANGYQSMVNNTSGVSNTAVGYASMYSNTTAEYNTAIGKESFQSNTTGSINTVIGAGALDRSVEGGSNAVLGGFAGRYIANGSSGAVDGGQDGASSNTRMDNSILIGAWTKPKANNETNQIVIGYNAVGNGSNTVQLGNTGITNVKTSGTITAGTITYPNTVGTNGYYLKTDGTGTATWAAVSGGGVPYTGATGVVDLGAYDLTVNGLTIGTGAGTKTSTSLYNTSVGFGALMSNTSGSYNSAVARGTLRFNTTGSYNSAFGIQSLNSNTTGNNNTASGNAALWINLSGNSNTAIGDSSLFGSLGDNNTAVGRRALFANTTGSNNTAIGYNSNVASNNLTNATAIGNGATVTASNTIQLGNSSVTNVKTSGTLTTGTVTYPNTNGITGQVLSATASGTITWTTASSSSGTHTIGESYGGGIVFYTWDNGLHGLIAATKEIGAEGPQNFSPTTGIKWGPIGTITGAFRFGVGGGFQNTDVVIAKNAISGQQYFDYGQTTTNLYAAFIAQQYSSYIRNNVPNSSFGDWYLPSMGELNLFYANKNSISGTGYNSNHKYWSSTEINDSYVYILQANGSQTSEYKGDLYYVLPIRKF